MSKIIPVDITDEIKESYLDYSMSVIVSRALPDVRDGLKPVHRRILFGAHELALHYNQPYKKSARLVGEVLGKFHPHGDVAIYDAIVRMAQYFSMRYPLIDGQGNFGSQDGDSAAAMRYTEVRLTKIAEEMLADIDKDTVDFMSNFDNTLSEPTVLPAKFPNLLVNGTSGIAVGMATNIPPHNLNEIIKGIIHLIKNPNTSIEELMQFIKGPDFPTGAIIEGKDGIINAYKTGRGRIIISSKYHFEEKRNKDLIVIDEIPYQSNKSKIMKNIAELAKNLEIDMSDLRDESDRKHGVRIVIELKKGSDKRIVLNKVLAKTGLRTSYHFLMLALVNNQPRMLNLKQMLQYFIDHRIEVITRRTQYLLKKAMERLHIIKGLVIAISDIEKTVDILKKSKNVKIATERLKTEYNIDDIQAKAILDMKLQRIISLEQEKLLNEKGDLENKISGYHEILNNKEKVYEIIIDELNEIVEKYGDERKTQIKASVEDINIEDLIKDEPIAILINSKGFIKRIPVSELKITSRSNRAKDRVNEDITNVLITTTKQQIFAISESGYVYMRKAYMIEETSKKAKGMHLNHLFKLGDEQITALTSIGHEINPETYLFIVTNKGIVKKVKMSLFLNLKNSGIKAISLEKNEKVKSLFLTKGNDDIIIYTKKGMAIRFDENDVRDMGRTARGVKGITLVNDEIINAFPIPKENKDYSIITVSKKGKGKRTKLEEYTRIGRGGKGVTNIRANEVIFSALVKDEDEILLITRRGYVRRLAMREIPVQGRLTSGVILFRVYDNDELSSGIKIDS